jgi:hypothetical protein
MKKSFLIIVLLLLSQPLISQDKGTSDLSFSLGFETSNEFLNTVEDIISGTSYANTSVSPAYILTYKKAIADRWFLFADGSFQSVKEDVVQEGLTIGDVNTTYLTFGFGTDYHYISKDWFQMYSGASIAYTSQSSNFTTSADINDETDGYFNFHVNALGFRFGRALAAFVELGVGYRGFGTVGVSYQF